MTRKPILTGVVNYTAITSAIAATVATSIHSSCECDIPQYESNRRGYYAKIVFLAIGAGAILQVVYAIFNWMSKEMDSRITMPHNVAGFIIGLAIMYLTGLLVAG